MGKTKNIETEGVVTSVNRSNYIVELDNGHSLNCKAKGKMNLYKIRILEGDRVKVEISPYSMERGIITYRM